MAEILSILISSTPSMILLFIISLTLLGLVIFLIKKIFSRDGEIKPLGIRWGGSGKHTDTDKLFSDFKQKIILLERVFGDEYDRYLLGREDLNTQINRELKNVQRIALTRAIEFVCLEFSKLQEVDDSDTNDSFLKMGQILELYLRRDFSSILIERLDSVMNNPFFYEKNEMDINNEIQKMSDDCILSMRHKIKDYILISDIKILNKLFDVSTVKIKDNIDETIKQFIKLNKKQQTEIINLNTIRNQNISKRIAEIIEKDLFSEKKD
jgi:hypothetical protein